MKKTILNKKHFRVLMISTLFIRSTLVVSAQEKISRIDLLPDEKWYGAAVNESQFMPFKPGYTLDLNNDVRGNQAAPLLLSNKGRYIWSNKPFRFEMEDKTIVFSDKEMIVVDKAGTTLADAYKAASRAFFAPSGKTPDLLLFQKPQYNTWIELIYNQNQNDILQYAHNIIRSGFEPGVLMIDDNWTPYYGRFEFRKDRFADPKAMIHELHDLGFKVMLWVCPFIRPDAEEARYLMKKKWVMMDSEGDKNRTWETSSKPAIVQWWNGFSMVMDFTNPDAVNWFQQQLDKLVQDYGIDGFKFDAGDPEFYPAGTLSFKQISSNEHTELWGMFGLKYSLNEYRSMWKRGGQPIAERLRDKLHNWEDLQKLIPGMTVAGLLGYPFACPDMIGGGDYSSFIDVNAKNLDQDLVVRSAQCHALMPMMQFSVAPWRILDSAHLKAVKNAVAIREKYLPVIMKLVEESKNTGEPVVRSMEYVFPNQEFANCKDQFMLGNEILVAPILNKTNKRTILLPKGIWKAPDGKTFKGPKQIDITGALNDLPIFVSGKNK